MSLQKQRWVKQNTKHNNNNRPFLGHNRSQTLAPNMRKTHVPFESVWERLVRAVEEGSKEPSKSLKGFKLRRTSSLIFSKTGLRLHTKKTAIAFVLCLSLLGYLHWACTVPVEVPYVFLSMTAQHIINGSNWGYTFRNRARRELPSGGRKIWCGNN